MPNPRANRPLTLDQVTADLKSFAQPAQALFDMMAGGLRGSAVGTFGAPGDIETLARMGLNAAGGSFNPAMPSRSGRAFQPVSEEPYFPSSEELAKRFAPTIPDGDAVRQKSAEPFEELGQFAPLPMSGKALKVLPYALGRGAGEATKMTGQALSDAMIHQTGPLSQGPLSMLAPKGAVSHVFEPNPNWKTNTVNFGKPTPGIMIPSKMSNVREAVRDLKGNYGARRVERAADEIPNLERMFKEDALKQAFTGDNASAMITLSPAEFERYSIELSKRHDIGPKMAQLAKEGNIDKYTVPTDEYIQYLQRLNEGFSDVPYLNLTKDEVGLPTMPRVSGHEGRHRSRALAEQGAPTSLVQINPRGDLREGMPRRTQEEFIEALKEELERSNRLVLPEKDGEYRRPAIELPEPYAEGGSVNMAAGGLLKGIKAIRKGALNAERSMPARGALSFADEPVGGPSVIKEKGGNWMSGSAEKAVGPLLQKGMINNREIPYGPEFDAAIRQRIEDLKQAASQPGYQGGAGRVVEHLERDLENPRANEAAINRWVQSNLTNYIKKEMATPEDTVRRLAEEGIVHIPSEQVGTNRYKAPDRRATMGGEQLGQSDAAKAWEDASDVSLRASRIRDLSGDYKEPWMANADPSTKIYSPGREMDALGFDHIVDVLREDIATGRIRPEQLSKVSMEQAVRRTYEYDQELAKKMAEARTSAREGLPVHKEYPEGYRWVELNRPGAFASESEAMGHSVKGYEPPVGHPDWAEGSGESGSSGYGHGGWEAIKSGKAKVYSLVDPKGEPHVTVEVGASKTLTPEKRAAQIEFLMNRLRGEGMSEEQAMSQAIKLYPESETLSRITQIKGKGNRAPKEEYLPFVQDFVKGGKWSDVGDLHNTQLTHIENVPEVKQYRAAGMELPSYVTDKERDDLIYEYLKKTRPASDPDFMQSEYGFPPPEDGMKHGGSVHISDNPDTMMMELGDKRMKGGGAEDDTKPFIGYPNLAKQARYSRAVAPERGDVNLLKDPQTYAFLMGALGEAPDELGFTLFDSDEQKQKIKAAGEKGFVTGAVSQLGPLAQLGKKAGKKILSLAGEGINERMLSGRSLTPFVDTPAPVMFAVPPEKELTLPSKLPRAKPRSKEELRPLAQEMSEATQGGFYRPDPSKSVNPAGKSFDQWKTEQGLVHDIRPTAKHQAIPRADIEKQKGMVKMGISGDTTVAEQVLHEAGPYALDIPSPQHGGALYGLGGEGAWASNNPIAANVQKRVNEISQAYDDAPVLGQYMQMGKLGSDFALHFADANLRAINLKKMSKDQIEMVNELIRKGSPKSGPRTSFPGIQDKDSAYLHFAVDPELRKHFNAIMQKPTYTEPLGLPDGRIIHHSITEPALRDLPVTTTGFSQMELHPGYDPEKLLLSEHPTYSHVIPHKPNTGLTRTQYHTPAQVEFPDVHEYLTKSGPRIYNTQDMTRMYQTSTPRQIIDQQHIDEIKMFEDLMKQYGGKKKGGAIHVKPRKPKVGVTKMMARGGEVNADDLILEERPL